MITRFFKEHYGASLVIGCALVFQVVLIAQPFSSLITQIIPDDSFYYFEIAKNAALGLGSTFDGVSATNGYHPLWLLILIPLYKITAAFGLGMFAPIQIALFFSVLLNLGTGIFVYALLSRITPQKTIRTLSLMLFLWNPYLVYETINGLETALALFLTAAFFFLSVRAAGSQRLLPTIVSGAVGGAMVLARLDLGVFVAAVFLWSLWRSPNQTGMRRALALAIPVGLIVLPWVVWNTVGFGMFLTSASGANTLVNHVLIEQDNGSGVLQFIKATVYNTDRAARELLEHTGAAGLMLIMAGAAFAFIARNTRIQNTLRDNETLYVLASGFLFLFLFNASVRWTVRSWYFVSFGIFVAFLAAFVLTRMNHEWAMTKRTKQATTAALAGAVLFLFFVSWHKDLRVRFPQQGEMYAAALWLNENVPPETNVGVFNAGIIGYVAHARVINLDGLVNNNAYEAMRDRHLWRYIREEEIEYIIDFPVYITYRYRSFFGEDISVYLDDVHRIVLESHSRSKTGIHVYKVLPQTSL